MKVNTGSIWYGWKWEKALTEHAKTSDCYFLEVYIDDSSCLSSCNWRFEKYQIMAYDNRLKAHKTSVPKRYNELIENIKIKHPDKFRTVNKWGECIDIVEA